MTPDQLAACMPLCPDAASWSAALDSAMDRYKIADRAAFLANVAHESSQLRALVENLNYSAYQLARTWPNRYANVDRSPNALAIDHARKGAQTIANSVYANRMGNGDPESGDGWRHRGVGPIQITGHDNQAAVAQAFGIAPDLVFAWMQTPVGGALSAARFWTIAGCNTADNFEHACDILNIGHATEKVGDSVGYASRLNFYNVIVKVLS